MTLAVLAATAAADTGSPIRESIQSERGISLLLGIYKVQALKRFKFLLNAEVKLDPFQNNVTKYNLKLQKTSVDPYCTKPTYERLSFQW